MQATETDIIAKAKDVFNRIVATENDEEVTAITDESNEYYFKLSDSQKVVYKNTYKGLMNQCVERADKIIDELKAFREANVKE